MKNLFAIVLIALLSINITLSQDAPERLLPKLLGASNTGKVFYLTFPPAWEIASPSNSIRIYISSQFKTTVKLEIPGRGIVKSKETIPNGVIEFVLMPIEGQPYSKGDGKDAIPPKPEQVWAGRAIKITAADPIICYGLSRVEFSSDGFLAIPINNWGKNYQVASYADVQGEYGQYLPSYTSIIASYDNTEVTFKLGGNPKTYVIRPNGDSIRFGESVKRILNTGDVWLLGGIGKNNDLTGSQISADKYIGVISGNFSTQVPTHIGSADYLIEQEVPMEYWGKKYFVPSIINRAFSSIVKVFVKEPNTTISYNNIPLYNIASLDGKSGSGYLETRTTSDLKPSPVLISSDKEINVVLFNPGQQDDQIESDPFQMNIVSDAQYQNNVTFNTPGIFGGEGFRINFLNIVFKSNTKSIPDDMIIGVIENESIKWTKLSDFFENYQLKSFEGEEPDEEGYLHYSFIDTLPGDGVYKLHAYQPFAAYGYGYSSYDSYGFPLAGAMIDQSSNDNLSPEINVIDLGNGNCEGQILERGILKGKIGKNKDELQAEDDIAGYTFVDMINALSYNYKFERDDFIPGETKPLKYKLTKIDSSKDSKAVIYVSDRRGNDTTIVVENGVLNSIIDLESIFGEINLYSIDKVITFKSNNEYTLNSYTIFDLNGKLIQSGNPNTTLNNYNIILNSISGSVYFIELNTQYGKVVKKIIVE
jgi:hypothetical protein